MSNSDSNTSGCLGHGILIMTVQTKTKLRERKQLCKKYFYVPHGGILSIET